MSTTTGSLIKAPHLPLDLSYSPLLTSNDMLPQLSEDEGTIFSSTVLTNPLRVPSLWLQSKGPPLQDPGGVVDDLSPLSTSTSTTSFDITYTTLSSCTFSLLTPSSSSGCLADKPLPSLPQAANPITVTEITSLLDLLERLDDDVTKEVLRVKAGIQETRAVIRRYKAERSSREKMTK